MKGNALRKQKESSRTSTSVLQFPTRNPDYIDPQTGGAFMGVPQIRDFGERLQAELETVIAKAYFQQFLSTGRVPDDPFDEVFLSRLEPDSILESDVLLLQRFSNIQDLSDSISFNDGWDD